MKKSLLSFAVLFCLTEAAHAGPSYLVKLRSPVSSFTAKLGVEILERLPELQMIEVQISSPRDLQRLKNSPEVEFVEADASIPAPRPAQPTPPMRDDTETTPTVTHESNELSWKSELTWGLRMIHGEEAWNEFSATTMAGAGIRVAVLDSGIDSTNPELMGKVESGKNFGGGFFGTSSGSEDYSDDSGHGTHVAGTIAASRDGHGVAGVAPGVKLLAGRVCHGENCSRSSIVKGLNWAIEQHVDVVNLSLGSTENSSSLRNAIARAETAGIVVVAASGNSNKAKLDYPAAYDTVISVGAVDEKMARALWMKKHVVAGGSNYGPQLKIVAPGDLVLSTIRTGKGQLAEVNVDTNGQNDTLKTEMFHGSPLTNGVVSGQLVDTGFGSSSDFAGKDLKNKIALCSRGGGLKFREKVANAARAGAIGIVIFNNEPGLQPYILDQNAIAKIPAMEIELEQGTRIRELLSRGASVVANMKSEKSDYDYMSGTSMASPHVAGVVALIRAANRSLTPAQVREILRASATPLASTSDKNEFGAGLLNAQAAVSAALHMLPSH